MIFRDSFDANRWKNQIRFDDFSIRGFDETAISICMVKVGARELLKVKYFKIPCIIVFVWRCIPSNEMNNSFDFTLYPLYINIICSTSSTLLQITLRVTKKFGTFPLFIMQVNVNYEFFILQFIDWPFYSSKVTRIKRLLRIKIHYNCNKTNSLFQNHISRIINHKRTTSIISNIKFKKFESWI